MILRKKTFSLDEQQAMREAAGLLTQLLRLLYKHTTGGVCGQDLVRYAWQFLKKHHCQANFFQYHGFPAPICVSVNENLIHGIPDEYLFQAGDLVSVDAGLL